MHFDKSTKQRLRSYRDSNQASSRNLGAVFSLHENDMNGSPSSPSIGTPSPSEDPASVFRQVEQSTFSQLRTTSIDPTLPMDVSDLGSKPSLSLSGSRSSLPAPIASNSLHSSSSARLSLGATGSVLSIATNGETFSAAEESVSGRPLDVVLPRSRYFLFYIFPSIAVLIVMFAIWSALSSTSCPGVEVCFSFESQTRPSNIWIPSFAYFLLISLYLAFICVLLLSVEDSYGIKLEVMAITLLFIVLTIMYSPMNALLDSTSFSSWLAATVWLDVLTMICVQICSLFFPVFWSYTLQAASSLVSVDSDMSIEVLLDNDKLRTYLKRFLVHGIVFYFFTVLKIFLRIFFWGKMSYLFPSLCTCSSSLFFFFFFEGKLRES